MVAGGKFKGRRTKDKVGRRSSYVVFRSSCFVLLSSLFALFLIAGCHGEDITPPEVNIIAPADGDTIAGPTTIRANATDNKRVARVEFFVDAVRIGIDSSPSGHVFEYAWLGVMRPGTAHTLTCFAADDAGNRNSSPAITVHVSSAAGTHHSGTIGAPETWTAAASPHVVDSDLYIEAILTLQPGAAVLVADGATIAVGTHSPAGIVAQGRADSVIAFSALNPTPGPGAWSGIQFRANAVPGSNVLRHCTIEYAGAGAGALVRCDAGAAVIDSCRLGLSSGRGVAATGDGLRSIAYTTISDCAGYPISLSPGRVSAIGPGNVLTANAYNAVELSGGTVVATDTWPNRGLPYHITATITIADAANPLITIAPGCSLLFGESAALRVGVSQPGGLRADGTYGRITFASIAAPGSGNWRGLEFWEKTDPVHTGLNYCRIQGAGAGNASAITCYSVPVAITNTGISNCSADGVYCLNTGFAQLQNDTITGCAGFPLHIAAQYITTIGNGNSFAGNTHNGIEVTGGAITRDAQYRRQDVPYMVHGDITVGSAFEPTLVIESGVVFQFDSGAALTIGDSAPAQLQAIGSPDSITFTAATSAPGKWNGLELSHYASSSSRIERCQLLYGGGANHGILYIDGCIPTITANEIAWSSNYCVYAVNSEIDPDTLWARNWLHDWAPGSDSIYYEPPAPKSTPDRGNRSGAIR